jgi:dipeptidyl-peptidase-4
MKKLLIPFALLLWASTLFAQKTLSMADAINKRAALAPTNLKQIKWVPGTGRFTHTAGTKLVSVNAANLSEDTLDILPAINRGMEGLGETALKGIPGYEWIDKNELWFQTEKGVFSWSLPGGLVLKNHYSPEAENLDIHKKTMKAAFTVGSELHISDGGSETIVAQSEGEGIVYGKSVHRDEFGIHKGTFWSESGRYLAFYRMDESMVTQYPIYVLDSMPATERKIRYPYAGAKSHHVTVGVFDTKTSKTIYLNTGEPAEQYLTNVAWSPDDKYVLIAVVNRAQNHFWVRQYDAITGAFVKNIFEETNEKWVEPEHPAEFVPGTVDQFIWQSERDGFNHLYLYGLDGKVIRQLSKGNFPVTTFYGFSTDGSRCFYQTADESGMNRYLWACSLKDGKTERLNTEEGVHNGTFSPEGDWVVDVFSNLATPRLVNVQKTSSTAERKLIYGSKNPLEEYQIGTTLFAKIPSPGGMMLNARLILPTNYDSGKKYPAIVYVYNGPHVQMVTNSWLGQGELWMHRMANEGYVVMSIDGRGSANRGRDFEQAIHRRAGDCEMEDQLTGVQYLKAQSYIDPARIGVFGWSYGGFMATSLMTRPEAKDVFKCGIAGGPVLDWSMYEIMYTERYMDTPQENPEGYKKNTLYNYIDNLNGRLLMIHGTSDNVVLWQHSLKYVQQCVKKGKLLDYFVYPEHEHNVMGPDRAHLYQLVERFFKEQL